MHGCAAGLRTLRAGYVRSTDLSNGGRGCPRPDDRNRRNSALGLAVAGVRRCSLSWRTPTSRKSLFPPEVSNSSFTTTFEPTACAPAERPTLTSPRPHAHSHTRPFTNPDRTLDVSRRTPCITSAILYPSSPDPLSTHSHHRAPLVCQLSHCKSNLPPSPRPYTRF